MLPILCIHISFHFKKELEHEHQEYRDFHLFLLFPFCFTAGNNNGSGTKRKRNESGGRKWRRKRKVNFILCACHGITLVIWLQSLPFLPLLFSRIVKTVRWRWWIILILSSLLFSHVPRVHCSLYAANLQTTIRPFIDTYSHHVSQRFCQPCICQHFSNHVYLFYISLLSLLIYIELREVHWIPFSSKLFRPWYTNAMLYVLRWRLLFSAIIVKSRLSSFFLRHSSRKNCLYTKQQWKYPYMALLEMKREGTQRATTRFHSIPRGLWSCRVQKERWIRMRVVGCGVV